MEFTELVDKKNDHGLIGNIRIETLYLY
jgi:hypothetical protein